MDSQQLDHDTSDSYSDRYLDILLNTPEYAEISTECITNKMFVNMYFKVKQAFRHYLNSVQIKSDVHQNANSELPSNNPSLDNTTGSTSTLDLSSEESLESMKLELEDDSQTSFSNSEFSFDSNTTTSESLSTTSTILHLEEQIQVIQHDTIQSTSSLDVPKTQINNQVDFLKIVPIQIKTISYPVVTYIGQHLIKSFINHFIYYEELVSNSIKPIPKTLIFYNPP
mmetsp:Transcript_19823/g.18004  ORF Transcript_19823/g.18004 Transcript_19823/m.18004 type:complete len:226 (+) Transcript_19823:763-1440(+)